MNLKGLYPVITRHNLLRPLANLIEERVHLLQAGRFQGSCGVQSRAVVLPPSVPAISKILRSLTYDAQYKYPGLATIYVDMRTDPRFTTMSLDRLLMEEANSCSVGMSYDQLLKATTNSPESFVPNLARWLSTVNKHLLLVVDNADSIWSNIYPLARERSNNTTLRALANERTSRISTLLCSSTVALPLLIRGTAAAVPALKATYPQAGKLAALGEYRYPIIDLRGGK